MKEELLKRLAVLEGLNKRVLAPEKGDQYGEGYRDGCLETMKQIRRVIQGLPEQQLELV